MSHSVGFSPEAIADLTDLLDYLLLNAGEAVARRYVDEITEYCLRFETFPKRGTLREDLAPGVRIVGFRYRASIVFRVEDDSVIILRIFHGGRDIHIGDV